MWRNTLLDYLSTRKEKIINQSNNDTGTQLSANVVIP